MNEKQYYDRVKWIETNLVDYDLLAGRRGKFRPLFPQTDCEFMLLLAEVERIQPKVIVEIGSRHGGSFLCFTTLLKPELAIALDLPDGPWGRKHSFKNLTKVVNEGKRCGVNTIAIDCDTHKPETLELLKKHLGGRKIDFLFIDGDHTYDGVKQDFEMYSPLVRDGGIIGFHDVKKKVEVTKCKVDELWNELTPNFHTKEFVFSCGIGLLYYKAKEI